MKFNFLKKFYNSITCRKYNEMTSQSSMYSILYLAILEFIFTLIIAILFAKSFFTASFFDIYDYITNFLVDFFDNSISLTFDTIMILSIGAYVFQILKKDKKKYSKMFSFTVYSSTLAMIFKYVIFIYNYTQNTYINYFNYIYIIIVLFYFLFNYKNVITISKYELRLNYKKVREKVEKKELKSKEIIKKILELEEYKKAETIAIYKNFSSEVSTTELIKLSLENNKIVCLPKIKNGQIEFYKVSSVENDLAKNKFGIEEPIEDKENLIDRADINLMIVPGLCFDMENNRLGFGKGYYDKYLENTEIYKIGICFDEQILKNKIIPVTSNDIKMNKIITDKQIIVNN